MTYRVTPLPTPPAPTTNGQGNGSQIVAARPHRVRTADANLARKPLLLLCDIAALTGAIALGSFVRLHTVAGEGPDGLASSLANELPYLPLYLAAMAIYGLYKRDRRRIRSSFFLDMGALLHALSLGGIMALAVSAGLHRFGPVTKLGWVEVFCMSVPALALAPPLRAAANVVLRRHGVLHSRIVVVGSGAVANTTVQRLQRCPDLEVLGFVDDEPHLAAGHPPCRRLGTIDDLPRVCAESAADRVLVAFSSSAPRRVMEVLRELPPAVHVSVVPRLFELVTWQSQVEELHGLTVMDIAPPQLGLLSRAVKRALDIAVSAGLLFLLSPALVAIAIAIKLTSPGPVLFRQPRAGRAGKPFEIFKFRSMMVGADRVKIDLREHNEVDGPLFKLRSDPRVTKIGAFLRRTSLDEVPQLFNVLIGQMSLVGPRPFVPDEAAEIDGWAARRYDVRPGMTGLWQISGRNDLPFAELQHLDYAYVASWSLWWDLKILWHTPATVFVRHDGAY
jgi:exopolysaccharide biosynthesis polyprenyl glycosylphosphotransferase